MTENSGRADQGRPLRIRSRRDFLKLGVAGGVASALAPVSGEKVPRALPRETRPLETGLPFAAPPLERVRIGFVGVGGMGSVHVNNLVRIEGVEIRAICDI